MDLYKEYNRIRRNLMRQAKYHNIGITKIPTAKQLLSQTGKSKISKSDIKVISTQKQSLHTIIKSTPKVKNKISVTTFRTPKIKPNKPKEVKEPKPRKSRAKSNPSKRGKKPNYEKYYSKYGTTYTKTTSEGLVIDRFTGEEIGYSLFATKEEIGKYIYDKYRDKNKRKMTSPLDYDVNKAASEYELFVKHVQDRVTQAFEYYEEYSKGRKDISKFGIETIQKALTEFKKRDWQEAYKRYDEMGTMLKQYLDQALYYTNEISDHARAIVTVLKILDLDVEDFNFDDIENATFDMGDILEEYG